MGVTSDEGPGSETELARLERAEAEQLREAELQAVLRELAVKDSYIKETELELTRIEVNVRGELAQVRARAAELFGDLERAEAIIADLRAEITALKARRSYRWSATAASLRGRLAAVVRRMGPGGSRPDRPGGGKSPGQARVSQ